MPKKKAKTETSDNAIYNVVNLWTNITDEEKIRHEVERWTKQRHALEEKLPA